jgi:hypothetical protein
MLLRRNVQLVKSLAMATNPRTNNNANTVQPIICPPVVITRDTRTVPPGRKSRLIEVEQRRKVAALQAFVGA